MRLLAAVVLLATSAMAQTPPADDAATLLAEGRRQLATGAAGRAADLFRQAIDKEPGNAVLHNELGVALFQQGASEAAIAPLMKAVKLDPTLANAWANLGEAERRAKHFKPAAVAFHRYLELRKGDKYGLYGLALSFEGYEAFDKALQTLNVAEKQTADDPRLLSRIRTARARVQEKVAAAKLPATERGDALFRAGRWADALAVYERGLRDKADDATLLGRRGLVRAVLGDLDAARHDFEDALRRDPAEEVAAAAYALLADASGEPGVPDADPGQGRSLLAVDRAAMAHRAFRRGLVGEPGNVAFRMLHGEAALRLGLVDEALQDFSGDVEGAAAGRAEVHLLRGEAAEAEEAAGEANAPVPLADLPVWRRSLLER